MLTRHARERALLRLGLDLGAAEEREIARQIAAGEAVRMSHEGVGEEAYLVQARGCSFVAICKPARERSGALVVVTVVTQKQWAQHPAQVRQDRGNMAARQGRRQQRRQDRRSWKRALRAITQEMRP